MPPPTACKAVAGNDKLLGGGGNDILLGASTAAPFGAAEIDTLTGGAGNDVFKLGVAAGRLYDDNNAATAGLAGYALVTDFTAGDKLQLKGAVAQYRLGASPAGLPAGQGLFHDSNANGILNPTDELIAVIQGPNAANALVGCGCGLKTIVQRHLLHAGKKELCARLLLTRVSGWRHYAGTGRVPSPPENAVPRNYQPNYDHVLSYRNSRK